MSNYLLIFHSFLLFLCNVHLTLSSCPATLSHVLRFQFLNLTYIFSSYITSGLFSLHFSYSCVVFMPRYPATLSYILLLLFPSPPISFTNSLFSYVLIFLFVYFSFLLLFPMCVFLCYSLHLPCRPPLMSYHCTIPTIPVLSLFCHHAIPIPDLLAPFPNLAHLYTLCTPPHFTSSHRQRLQSLSPCSSSSLATPRLPFPHLSFLPSPSLRLTSRPPFHFLVSHANGLRFGVRTLLPECRRPWEFEFSLYPAPDTPVEKRSGCTV